MERRYLVAALAIIATFAVVSRGFRSLEQLSLQHAHHLGMVGKAKCGASSAARAVAKIRTRLHPRYPEEAQLLAEMNVPMPAMETIAAPLLPSVATPCAHATAAREAERARRDAERMREDMARSAAEVSFDPISLQVNLPADMQRRIQERTSDMAVRIAENNARLQMATSKFRDAELRIADAEVGDIQVISSVSPNVVTHVHCNVDTRWHDQARQAVRNAMRNFQYGFTSK